MLHKDKFLWSLFYYLHIIIYSVINDPWIGEWMVGTEMDRRKFLINRNSKDVEVTTGTNRYLQVLYII